MRAFQVTTLRKQDKVEVYITEDEDYAVSFFAPSNGSRTTVYMSKTQLRELYRQVDMVLNAKYQTIPT